MRRDNELNDGMAVVLGKCQYEHFCQAFGLSTHGCEVAHSACVGFGAERIVLGFIRPHGFEPAMWSTRVRLK
ncbi:MAG: hypothetical protein JO082_02985 [Mycobacterium sp.]|nr:hypothetical protein [Mycobacterium sp.]